MNNCNNHASSTARAGGSTDDRELAAVRERTQRRVERRANPRPGDTFDMFVGGEIEAEPIGPGSTGSGTADDGASFLEVPGGSAAASDADTSTPADEHALDSFATGRGATPGQAPAPQDPATRTPTETTPPLCSVTDPSPPSPDLHVGQRDADESERFVPLNSGQDHDNVPGFVDSNPSLRDDEPFTPPPARAIGRRISQRITGENRTFDYMRTTYPATADPAFARLMLALLSPRRTSVTDDGRAVMLSGPTLAGCMGRESDYAAGNLRKVYDGDGDVTSDETTGAFLQAFRDAVLPALEWNEFVKGEKVREVDLAHLRSILDPRLVKLLDLDLATDPATMEDRVYLDSGAKFNSFQRSREHDRWMEAMRHVPDRAPCGASARLWRLLASTPTRTFSALPGRLGLAWASADTLEKAQAREDARRDARHIADYPFQWYRFSPYTVRLIPANPGVASVASPVRRAFLFDSYEIDLASAHLAIVAAEWGCDELFAFLDAGRSFWPTILAHMGLDYNEANKAAVKRGTYALVYGAGDDRILGDIRSEYRKLTGQKMDEATAERFMAHPLVAEVKAARDAKLAEIRTALDTKMGGPGYVVDCFDRRLAVGQMEYGDGIKRSVRGPDAARSILSQVAQARELWLLEPIIAMTEAEYAKGNGSEWRLTCWSHDGFNVKFRRQRDAHKHLQAMKDAVAARAAEVSIPTCLEVKYDPS